MDSDTIQVVDEFANLMRQMYQLMGREMNRPAFGFSPMDAFRPAVNLYETLTAFIVCVDLAGMDQKDIEVSLEKGTVVIHCLENTVTRLGPPEPV